MDWDALRISVSLALATALLLTVPGILLARWLVNSKFGRVLHGDRWSKRA